ncbi:hypothetical protein Dsin_019345 [Dipteronia sinensis]|uniref:Aldehyde dehydrogenase n=1 Tax=Dipteronia sinensis TaxID=43782 RepID=A0AAE0A7S0_9ROSI|nr:hypothetical protein Dsin_019345 [Dipteronia sinensis]
MESVRDLETDLEDMREYYSSGITKQVSWRKSQLEKLLILLKEKRVDIFKALKKDLGKHHVEAFRDEIGTLIKSVNYALENLKGWTSSKTAKLPIIAILSSAEVVPEPLGLVLIMSSWNFPFGLSLEPMIGAIAAGNTMVLKPSELAPASSAVLADAISTYLDNKAIKVIEGGPCVGQQLLLNKWDKIFFTGSSRVGRQVMSAAVQHLTPVTLELGGKCPVVLDSLTSSWDREVAINRIIVSKYGACAGQACIAIDYVLVEEQFTSTVVNLMKASIKKMFGEKPRETNSVARIINKQHLFKLKNLLSDPMVKDTIVYGGSVDEDNLFVEPTILVDPPLEAEIMTEEIFGPILPIISLKKIEDSINFINARPKALSIYVFTKNEALKSRMLSETSSGSLIFNDAVIQYAADSLPFGGVGESGIGQYHGKFSFDAFSHYKAVARRSFLTDFWFRFPPWNDYKLQLFENAYNFDYLGMLLVILGLKRKRSTNEHF